VTRNARNANTVSVTILEKEYQVACPKDQQAELLLSARHLDEQMRAIRATGKVIGLERIAVMAALNISHELLQTRNGVAPATTSGATDGDAEAAPTPASLAGLNAKLEEALHQLRQLEIG
jgi:cell division protein ZapA